MKKFRSIMLMVSLVFFLAMVTVGCAQTGSGKMETSMDSMSQEKMDSSMEKNMDTMSEEQMDSGMEKTMDTMNAGKMEESMKKDMDDNMK